MTGRATHAHTIVVHDDPCAGRHDAGLVPAPTTVLSGRVHELGEQQAHRGDQPCGCSNSRGHWSASRSRSGRRLPLHVRAPASRRHLPHPIRRRRLVRGRDELDGGDPSGRLDRRPGHRRRRPRRRRRQHRGHHHRTRWRRGLGRARPGDRPDHPRRDRRCHHQRRRYLRDRRPQRRRLPRARLGDRPRRPVPQRLGEQCGRGRRARHRLGRHHRRRRRASARIDHHHRRHPESG